MSRAPGAATPRPTTRPRPEQPFEEIIRMARPAPEADVAHRSHFARAEIAQRAVGEALAGEGEQRDRGPHPVLPSEITRPRRGGRGGDREEPAGHRLHLEKHEEAARCIRAPVLPQAGITRIVGGARERPGEEMPAEADRQIAMRSPIRSARGVAPAVAPMSTSATMPVASDHRPSMKPERRVRSAMAAAAAITATRRTSATMPPAIIRSEPDEGLHQTGDHGMGPERPSIEARQMQSSVAGDHRRVLAVAVFLGEVARSVAAVLVLERALRTSVSSSPE